MRRPAIRTIPSILSAPADGLLQRDTAQWGRCHAGESTEGD